MHPRLIWNVICILILLPPPPDCWDHRHLPLLLSGIEPMTSWILGEHSPTELHLLPLYLLTVLRNIIKCFYCFQNRTILKKSRKFLSVMTSPINSDAKRCSQRSKSCWAWHLALTFIQQSCCWRTRLSLETAIPPGEAICEVLCKKVFVWNRVSCQRSRMVSLTFFTGTSKNSQTPDKYSWNATQKSIAQGRWETGLSTLHLFLLELRPPFYFP